MAEATPVRDMTRTPPPPPTGPPPQQTPIAHKTVTQPFSMDATKEMKEVYEIIALETKGHYLVGLDPHRFLEECLPWNESTPNAYKTKIPSKQRLKNLQRVAPKPGQQESVMYEPFVEALDKWITKSALKSADVPDPQTLRFLNTKLPDTSCNNLNPDISTLWDRDFTNRTDFSRQQTHAEFKPGIGHDPFQHVSDEGPNDREEETVNDGDELGGTDVDEAIEDESDEDKGEETEERVDVDVELDNDDDDDGLLHEEEHAQEKINPQEVSEEEECIASDDNDRIPVPFAPSNVETDTVSGNHTRGQIAAYAGLALSMSFRNHFFSMLILGRYARFIRWDRRGAVVTRRFNYIKHPYLIFQFYLRYGQLTPLQRGFDPSVDVCENIDLPASVRKAFQRYHQSTWYGGARFKRSPTPLSFKGFLRIMVTDDKQGNTEAFFIPPPRYRRAILFPFCRATRRSLACPDPNNGKNRPLSMCFLKDSWQEVSLNTDREADIYRTLKAEGVKHVASMRLGGDVAGLETETHTWVEELHRNSAHLKGKMVCHRIILDTIARDLSTFSWCKVLLSCIADAVEAAEQAYKVGILHQDLSAGNIMIVKDKETKEWRGILIDWDMCLLWKKRKSTPRSGRTGTWAFISAKILQSRTPIAHTLWDDLESAFWVFLYQVLLYLRHGMDPFTLYKEVQLIFSDNTPLTTGPVVGGRGKRNLLFQCSSNMSSELLTHFDKPGLNGFLDQMGKLFNDRYNHPSDPRFSSDDLNNSWFPDRLREEAMKMEPLCITPTGLKSPTNDSNPPADREQWEAASVTDSKMDYYLMPISSNPKKSTQVQKRQASATISGYLHGMDGSLLTHGSKRRHISEPAGGEEDEEPVSKRRHR